MTTTAQASTPARTIAAPHREITLVALCGVLAAMLVVSGVIHLHLYNKYYKDISTGHINKQFLAQWILCFVGAAALLVMRNLLAVAAAGALLAGTFIGYLFARYHTGGIFGFYLGPHYHSGSATWALISEIVGTVVALVTAALMVRRSAAES
jgi:hypothetical protein